ncbi:MAG: site-specific integrase [Syntrophobacteraceae bacterium]|nr:site-specific integrase [Desulfobacteraceae bacterium]
MSVQKRSKYYYMKFKVKGIQICRSTGKTRKIDAQIVEKQERKRILRELEGDIKPERKPKKAPLKLSEAIERIFSEKWSTMRTGEECQSKMNRIVKIIGNIDINHIDENKITKIRNELRKSKIRESTINRYLAHLKTLLNTAKWEWNVIAKVPLIKLTPEKQGRIRVISKEEEATILQFLRAPQPPRRKHYNDVADLIEILVDTGMRLGEGLSLTYSDNIDLTNSLINLYPHQTKSYRARSIPITRRVSEILRKRKEKGLKPFRLSLWQVDKAFKSAKEAMNITDREFVIHALRHTCASRMINLGVDLYTIKKILGHSTIAVTEKYSHLDTSKLRKAVAMLEE